MNFKISKAHAVFNTFLALTQITLFAIVVIFFVVVGITNKMESKTNNNVNTIQSTPTTLFNKSY